MSGSYNIMARTWFVVLAALTAFAPSFSASLAADTDVEAIAKAIEQKSETGRFKEAWRDLEDLQTLLWEKLPLGITAALFVNKPAAGYGLYEPRENSDFSKDAPIFVYLRPVGYGYERNKDSYGIALSADFQLRTPGGQVLAEQDGFSRLTLQSRAPNREFQASFSFTFGGMEPGEYALLIRLRDENGGQSAETILPFTITADPTPE